MTQRKYISFQEGQQNGFLLFPASEDHAMVWSCLANSNQSDCKLLGAGFFSLTELDGQPSISVYGQSLSLARFKNHRSRDEDNALLSEALKGGLGFFVKETSLDFNAYLCKLGMTESIATRFCGETIASGSLSIQAAGDDIALKLEAHCGEVDQEGNLRFASLVKRVMKSPHLSGSAA